MELQEGKCLLCMGKVQGLSFQLWEASESFLLLAESAAALYSGILSLYYDPNHIDDVESSAQEAIWHRQRQTFRGAHLCLIY